MDSQLSVHMLELDLDDPANLLLARPRRMLPSRR